jgi:hypothetical protein
MAEATDRPQGAGPAPSNPEGRITTQAPAPGSSVPALDAGEPTAAETYRPLSLLALLGFGIAALYAVVVLIGAAVALFGRTPWLMPGWTFALPVAALFVCWVAGTRIRDSEGSLSGQAFATWGIRLTILVVLTYGAYYTATFFAIRGQAVERADDFFEQLKQGQNEQAFLMAMGIPAKDVKDMDSAKLRNEIEARFNNPKAQPGVGSMGGEYTRFLQSHFVRFIAMDGPKANITLRGVNDWAHNKDGYQVVLKYYIETTMAVFEMDVVTVGRDPKPGEPKGRQWGVRLPRDPGAESLKWTQRGKEIMDGTVKTAQQFANSFTERVNQNQWLEAYLETLPPSERSRMQKSLSALPFLMASPMAGLSSLGLVDANCRAFLASEKTLESSKLIRLDDKTFWAGKQQRAEIIQRVLDTFKVGPQGRSPFNLQLQSALPLIREREGKTEVVFDAGLMYLDSSAKPQYTVQGQLIVAAEGSDAKHAPSAWYVESINAESGRTPPEPPARGKRPGPGM